jgi:hypothetical protein
VHNRIVLYTRQNVKRYVQNSRRIEKPHWERPFCVLF